MNKLYELVGLKGVTGNIYAYTSKYLKDIRKALELGIACTGANDHGAYNVYWNDVGELCCEYMTYGVTKRFEKVKNIDEAIEWIKVNFNK